MLPVPRVNEVWVRDDAPVFIKDAQVVLIEALPNGAQIITLLHCVVDWTLCLCQ